jgi:hypothetical protein
MGLGTDSLSDVVKEKKNGANPTPTNAGGKGFLKLLPDRVLPLSVTYILLFSDVDPTRLDREIICVSIGFASDNPR